MLGALAKVQTLFVLFWYALLSSTSYLSCLDVCAFVNFLQDWFHSHTFGSDFQLYSVSRSNFELFMIYVHTCQLYQFSQDIPVFHCSCFFYFLPWSQFFSVLFTPFSPSHCHHNLFLALHSEYKPCYPKGLLFPHGQTIQLHQTRLSGKKDSCFLRKVLK